VLCVRTSLRRLRDGRLMPETRPIKLNGGYTIFGQIISSMDMMNSFSRSHNKIPQMRSPMTEKTVNHSRIPLAQKATRQQNNIGLMDMQREIGIAWSMLNFRANNQVTRCDALVIQAFYEYFDCQVGKLLVFKKDEPAK
jgi:hypothetical protein